MLSGKEKIKLLSQACADRKGFDIVCLDVRTISPITDYIIIVSGTSDRHVKAVAESAIDKLEELGESTKYCDGMDDGSWVLVDAYDVMIHVFKETVRDHYALEQLWQNGKKIKVGDAGK